MEGNIPQGRAVRLPARCGGCGERFRTAVGASLCAACKPLRTFDAEMAQRVIEYRLALEEITPLIARAANRGDRDAQIALEVLHRVQAPGWQSRVA